MIKTIDSSQENAGFQIRTFSNLIIGAWIIMQAILLWKNGIGITGEAEKYIYQARHLLANGELTSKNFYFYSVNITLIALGLKWNFGYYPIVIIQLLLNLTATLIFFRFCISRFNLTTGLIATILLIVFYPFQQFNTFLQTESIFYSLLIIFTCYLLSARQFGTPKLMVLIFVLLLLIFTRPTGILLLISAFCFSYFKFVRHFRMLKQLLSLVLVALIFFTGLNSIMRSGGELNFLLPYIEEHIICGVPTSSGTHELLKPGDNSFGAVLSYISTHFSQFLSLGLRRSIAFFGIGREYFSTMHNIVICSCFYLLYIFSVLSIRRWWKQDSNAVVYLFTTVVVTWVTAVLTCDDWHNRFILSVYPVFIVLSLPFIHKCTERYKIFRLRSDPKKNSQV